MASTAAFALTGPFDTGSMPRVAAAPVTVTVSRRVRAGHEADFDRWARTLIERANDFTGSLGAALLHPGQPGGEYHIVMRFVDGLSLRAWEKSTQRAELLAEAAPFVESSRVQRTVGVEDWFDLASRAEPKRVWWKQVLVDVAWVFPVAVTMSAFVAPFLARLPLPIATLVSAATITAIMRRGVGPLRSRLRARRRLG